MLLGGPNGARTVVVWPAGTRWDADEQAIVPPTGDTLHAGDTFQAIGTSARVIDALSVVNAEGDEYLYRCMEGGTDGPAEIVRHEPRIVLGLPGEQPLPSTTKP